MNPMDLSVKRVLIVKPSSLGDVVHTLPVVHAIKRCYPSCHVGWIVQAAFQGILEHDPSIDEILPISIPSTSDPHAPRGSFVRALVATLKTVRDLRTVLKHARYDYVLDLHASFRSGLFAMSNPDGVRVGFADAKELNTRFQHRILTPDRAKPHAVDRNLEFARFLHCEPQPDDFRVVSGAAARQRVRAFLDEAGISERDRVVYANPAARWETKFWTVSGWAELGDLLIQEAAAKVVFGGSLQDRAYIESIVNMMKQPAVVAAGRLNLSEAVALIDYADVYVGVDSGPMHVAAFAGTPVVALFGPTDPAKVGPYGDGHRVIFSGDVDCLACRKRSCTNRRCLEKIPASKVFDETVGLLGW